MKYGLHLIKDIDDCALEDVERNFQPLFKP